MGEGRIVYGSQAHTFLFPYLTSSQVLFDLVSRVDGQNTIVVDKFTVANGAIFYNYLGVLHWF